MSVVFMVHRQINPCDVQVEVFDYTLFFLSNTFLRNARLKFADFRKISEDIENRTRKPLSNDSPFLNSILNTFWSGRVRPIFGKFEFRQATFETRPKKNMIRMADFCNLDILSVTDTSLEDQT